MYQSSASSLIYPAAPSVRKSLYSNMHINMLVEEKKIIRILQPELQAQIESRLTNDQAATNVFIHQGQLFLSLQNIKSEENREAVFSLVRHLQIRNLPAESDQLPDPINQLLSGKKITSSSSHFVTSLTLSTFLGGISGVLALALAVIVLMVAGIETESETASQITAIVFAVGSILGCAICTLVIWYRLNHAKDANSDWINPDEAVMKSN